MKVRDPLRVSAAEAAGARPPAPPTTASEASYEDRLREDFRFFLIALWRHVLKTDPAPIMLDMAYWLQHGPDRAVIEAFRGFSKSWIAIGYCLWRLYRNPQEKVLIISGSATKAKEAVNWALMLVLTWDLLAHLRPRPDQRASSIAFDVGPSREAVAQAPSFKAIGITGQITGSRATVIIPDDVETQNNSSTPLARDLIKEAVKELDSVIVPEPGSVIKYLGTPHDEDSLYNELPKRGYTVRIWCARFPDQARIKKYGDKLAPYILALLEKGGPALVGRSTMPSRFTDDDLAKRELSIGRSTFDLQFMLDTTGADKDKYPLKMRDLMVASLDPRKGPEVITWTNDAEQRFREFPSAGFEGDFLHLGVIPPETARVPYSTIVGAIDPSGRGTDETALAVVAELHGMLFLLKLWATRDGYAPETLKTIAQACIQFGIHTLLIEDNFGDGMFTSLLQPVVTLAWEKWNKNKPVDAQRGTEIVSVKSSNQMAKEKRILAVLEPATQQHRLVVDRSVLEWDIVSVAKIEGEDTRFRYAFGHQYSRLTRERDALVHDDRLESVAIAVGHFADILGVDPQVTAKESRQDRLDEEWEKIFGPDTEEDELGIVKPGKPNHRPQGLKPARR